MMPLARYFVFAGAALMALLFAFDALSPKAVADNGAQNVAAIDKSTLRIKSEQKWPERIVFDTTQPAIAPKAVETQAALTAQVAPSEPQMAPQFTPTARVRETFAQFVPAEPKKADTVAKKKKTVKASPAQPLRLARSGWFGYSTW